MASVRHSRNINNRSDMEVKIKRLSEEAYIPQKATKGAVAYDLRVPRLTLVKTGRNIIPLDIAIELPDGYEFKIEPRSGFSAKGFEGHCVDDHGQPYPPTRYIANVLVGKVDSDYRGNVGVIVENRDKSFYVVAGERIAQGTIYKTPDTYFVEVSELSETERGEGGYGHTGTK